MATKTIEVRNPVAVARQAYLATIGGYVKAFEAAKDGIENAATKRDTLITELSEKGADVEAKTQAAIKENIETARARAQENIKTVRENMSDFSVVRAEKVRSLIPSIFSRKAKVTELEGKVATLNEKVAAAKKAPVKKAAPKKTASNKTAAKKAPVKKAALKQAPVKKTVVVKTVAPKVATKTVAPVAAPVANSVKTEAPTVTLVKVAETPVVAKAETPKTS